MIDSIIYGFYQKFISKGIDVKKNLEYIGYNLDEIGVYIVGYNIAIVHEPVVRKLSMDTMSFTTTFDSFEKLIEDFEDKKNIFIYTDNLSKLRSDLEIPIEYFRFKDINLLSV